MSLDGERPEPLALAQPHGHFAEAAPARPAPLTSEALLCGRRLVEIVHNGEIYRLQATRLGKLILTK
ncbi:MAG TPA: hemin uptake protein HemP [Ramlibacter sp.]|nr:hemin uptake protein HemP [Ramlibacter sp.]